MRRNSFLNCTEMLSTQRGTRRWARFPINNPAVGHADDGIMGY